jgi:hypothetical protein
MAACNHLLEKYAFIGLSFGMALPVFYPAFRRDIFNGRGFSSEVDLTWKQITERS